MKLVSVNAAYLLGAILMAQSTIALTERQLAATAPNLNYCPGSVKQKNRTHNGAFFALWNQTDASWNVPAFAAVSADNIADCLDICNNHGGCATAGFQDEKKNCDLYNQAVAGFEIGTERKAFASEGMCNEDNAGIKEAAASGGQGMPSGCCVWFIPRSQ